MPFSSSFRATASGSPESSASSSSRAWSISIRWSLNPAEASPWSSPSSSRSSNAVQDGELRLG